MHLDVLDLRQFYYRTRLGRAAQKSVRDQLTELWPDATGQTVVGFGFAVPLLRPYLGQAARVIGLMPGAQGVMPWPAGQDNVSVLCHETRWPLPAGTVDRLVVLHGLETSEHPASVLEECHRVLAPEGRVLFIVPNRRGLWARRDATPFGFGRPYSLGQLEAQLRIHGFEPDRHRAALFAPPSHGRFWLRSADLLERIGRRLSRDAAGGVIMLEASKHTFAPTRPGLTERVKRPLRILDSAPQPAGVSSRSEG
jgi:SAM-dependent methyltransferase